MTLINTEEKLLSIIPKKRFSKPRLYGTSQFGFSRFGEEDIYFSLPGQDPILLSGIYRQRKYSDGIRIYREPFYFPKNPRTEDQQFEREQFADAVSDWQNLDPEGKKVWNEKAIGLAMSGYNLFLKEYLLTH